VIMAGFPFLGVGAAAAVLAVSGRAGATSDDSALSALLLRQTQAFSEAGQKGDAATMDRLLDPEVVFTNENGEIGGKHDLLDGVKPAPAGAAVARIEVTQWAMHRQGDALATGTFIDQVTRVFGDQRLVVRYQSTETWIKRKEGWRMIVSQTMNVPGLPKAVTLPAAALDEYVGVYALGSAMRVTIARSGAGLAASTNGAAAVPLEAELRDVMFTPAAPTVRRIFQRDAAGRVTGFISRREGADLVFAKVG
jgi:hypothetical protein